MPEDKWMIHWEGDEEVVKDEEEEFELSVIRTDNTHGLNSWGWGGLNKIILFSHDGENAIDLTDKDFAMECAKILCDGLNNKK